MEMAALPTERFAKSSENLYAACVSICACGEKYRWVGQWDRVLQYSKLAVLNPVQRQLLRDAA